MVMNFKTLILSFFLIFVCNISKAQVSTYTFIDPCTKEVTMFSVPIQGGKTMIIFLDNVGYFDANDLSNGNFSNWVNQVYTKYRQTNPCSQQQGQVIQNQITAQIIGGTIQSVVSSILSSSQSQSTSLESGSSSSDAGGKDNKNSEKKKNNNSSQTNGNNSSQSNTTSTTSTQTGGQSQTNSGTNNSNGGSGSTSGNGNTTNGGGTSGSGNTTQGGNSTTQPSVGTNTSTNNNSGSTNSGGSGGTNTSSSNNTNTTTGNNGTSTNTSGGSTTNTNGSATTSGSGGSNTNNSNSGGSNTNGSNGNTTGGSTNGNSGGSNGGTTSGTNTTGGSGSSNTNNTNTNNQKGEEVGATTQMNNDAHNDNNAGGGSNSGGKGKSGGGGSARSNPIIVSSDITSAQNLNRTFTPIVNIGTSKSSMTGLSSYGVTGMVWLNFKQFAVSAKYTKIHYSKSKKLKFIHNLNLTGVYTYGNYLGFVGYSGILNGGKYGVTGFNISGAATIISEEKSGYYSPSITAFYTRPIKVSKKMIISPELYVISTPLVYSTKDKVSISDRYVSGFVGTGIDYQISKRFKLNVNYKANMSTNPEFPILSFFLIGSKINL